MVLVSYPMVGAQKGDSREQILLDLPQNVDVLFVSGDRDSMCSVDRLQMAADKMKTRTWIAIVEGADHGMSAKPKSTDEPTRKATGRLAAEWLASREESGRFCKLSWNAEKRRVDSTGWRSELEPR